MANLLMSVPRNKRHIDFRRLTGSQRTPRDWGVTSRGRGRRERPRGIGQARSVFDQRTFVEAVGITANAIAQAGIAGR